MTPEARAQHRANMERMSARSVWRAPRRSWLAHPDVRYTLWIAALLIAFWFVEH